MQKTNGYLSYEQQLYLKNGANLAFQLPSKQAMLQGYTMREQTWNPFIMKKKRFKAPNKSSISTEVYKYTREKREWNQLAFKGKNRTFQIDSQILKCNSVSETKINFEYWLSFFFSIVNAVRISIDLFVQRTVFFEQWYHTF